MRKKKKEKERRGLRKKGGGGGGGENPPISPPLDPRLNTLAAHTIHTRKLNKLKTYLIKLS